MNEKTKEQKFEVSFQMGENVDPEKVVPTIKKRIQNWLRAYGEKQAASVTVKHVKEKSE